MSSLPVTQSTDDLARLLTDARARNVALDTLPSDLQPSNVEEAYDAQHATLRLMRAAIGGWKVGAKSPTGGPIQCAPLPAGDMHRVSATLPRDAYLKPGLELEIAFVLGRRFDANSGHHSDEAVLDSIDTVHAAIEVVASRYRAWPDVDKLWQLADLLNHGALIVGEGVRYERDFPFVEPSMRFAFDGAGAFEGKPANPAGDPRRLLGWLVNHCVSRGLTLERGTVLTCGSYTGMYFPEGTGIAKGTIDGLPPVQLTFS